MDGWEIETLVVTIKPDAPVELGGPLRSEQFPTICQTVVNTGNGVKLMVENEHRTAMCLSQVVGATAETTWPSQGDDPTSVSLRKEKY